MNKKNYFLLSTDTLSWYWLDLIFSIAKELNFDWIDLCLWKNFDARNIEYLEKLVEKYSLPIKIIQVSSKVNSKELNQAVVSSRKLWINTITINPPSIFDIKTYRFITANLKYYKKQNPDIKFSIINSPDSSLWVLPFPKYYFNNIREIIRKYNAELALDISNIKELDLEELFKRKLSNYIPYIKVIYLSDKTKTDKPHVPLWEGVLKLPFYLKKLKQNEYDWYFSLKLELSKQELLDIEKVHVILKKCRLYYIENYENLSLN